MPEIRFQIQWPDGTQATCYSPSLVVKDYFEANQDYDLTDFVERSRTAYGIASERVRAKYGFGCSLASGQLQQIESMATQFSQMPDSKVRVIEFFE